MLSESAIESFRSDPVWLEMLRRISNVAAEAERGIENPDPFTHGIAVGARRSVRIILDLPEQFLKEIKSGGRPVSLKP